MYADDSLNDSLRHRQGHNSHGDLSEILPIIILMRIAPNCIRGSIDEKRKSQCLIGSANPIVEGLDRSIGRHVQPLCEGSEASIRLRDEV
jgi:hypothetical protein